MATAGRLIRIKPRPDFSELTLSLSGLESLERFWRACQRRTNSKHVTRVRFRVSILTPSASYLKLFLKGISLGSLFFALCAWLEKYQVQNTKHQIPAQIGLWPNPHAIIRLPTHKSRKETNPNSDNLANGFAPCLATRAGRLFRYRQAAQPRHGVAQSGRGGLPV